MAEQLFFTSAKLEIEAAGGDQKLPRVTILAYGGALMSVPGWGPVIIDLDNLDISGAITLLADHENKLREVVGTGTATVQSGQLFIHGTLTRATEAGRMVLGLHADNVPLQASVGVAPGKQSWLSEGETIHVNGRDLVAPVGGAAFIESGKLRETSLTPLGSDSETRVSIAATQKQRTRTMKDPNIPNPDDAILAPGTEDRLDAAAVLPPDEFVQLAEQRQRLLACWDASGQLTTEENKHRARELRASASRVGFARRDGFGSLQKRHGRSARCRATHGPGDS